ERSHSPLEQDLPGSSGRLRNMPGFREGLLLHVQIHEYAIPRGRENLFERWHTLTRQARFCATLALSQEQCRYLRKAAVGDPADPVGCALEGLVVDRNETAVARSAHVDLHHCDTKADAFLDGPERVLRCNPPAAAMRHDHDA